MKKIGTGIAAVLLLLAVLPATSSAAVCADYPNQAAAQRAADTRDADGDGVYCESLPCPCLRPGEGGGGGGSTPAPAPKPAPPPRRAEAIAATVLHVVDGDTIDVRAYGAARSRYRVRLIGIDTPERYGGRECGAAQATAYMQRLAWKGRRVTLRTDPTQDQFDRYGRLLAYVDVKTGSFQAKMLTVGWAKVYVYGGVRFQRADGFEKTAAKAKRRHRGAWGKCRGNFHLRARTATGGSLDDRNRAADREASRRAERAAANARRLQRDVGL